ncbi:hypothetical protein [Micromonospora sp. I033]
MTGTPRQAATRSASLLAGGSNRGQGAGPAGNHLAEPYDGPL